MSTRSGSPRARRLARAGATLGVVATLFVGISGFLHTSAGRPLLAKLTGGKCPFGHQRLEPAQRDKLRHLGLSKLAHVDTAAPARPALGFELGRLQQSDVVKWTAERGFACKSESKGSGLACNGVPSTALGEPGGQAGALYFRFDAKKRLVGVLSMVRTRDAHAAVALGEAERSKLSERLGAPTRASGELTVASLERGPLRQARAEHRYRDFSALASVTNLGPEGYLVTEEAQLVD